MRLHHKPEPVAQMSRLPDINLIRLFDFYLLMMFVIGLLRRAGFYKDVTLVSIAAVMRQPHLVRRLGANRDVLMNWTTLRPVFFAILLLSVQYVLSRLIWPEATLTGRDVSHSWWHCGLLMGLFIPMFAVDVYFLIRVGQIDRGVAHEHLARAEYWLAGWRGPAVRVVTLGYVNPRKMVNDQLRDSLMWFRGTMAWSMWWTTIQVGLRVLFGLAIWSLWAASVWVDSV